MDQRLGLIREEALGEKFSFQFAAFRKRQFCRSFHGIDGRQRRHQAALLLAGIFTRRRKDSRVLFRRAKLVIAFPCLWGGLAGDLARKIDRARQQVTFDQSIDDSVLQRLFGFDGIPFGAHFNGLSDSGKPWQPLRASCSGNQSKLHFGLANLRAGNGYTIMTGHRQL